MDKIRIKSGLNQDKIWIKGHGRAFSENLISAFYEVGAKFLRWRMGEGTKSVETISKIPIFSILAQSILTTLRLRKIGSKCKET